MPCIADIARDRREAEALASTGLPGQYAALTVVPPRMPVDDLNSDDEVVRSERGVPPCSDTGD